MDSMRIQSHLRTLQGVGQLGPRPEIGVAHGDGGGQLVGEGQPANFGDMLSKSIGQVNDRMNEASAASEALATGKTNDITQTLISLQKADISFKMLVEVRNKVMKAYEEVMRMQA